VNFQRLASTQGYALLVGIVVIAAVAVVIVSGGVSLGSDDDEDALALAETPSTTASDASADVESDGDSAASTQADDNAPADDGPGASAAAASAALERDQPFQFGDLRIAVTDLRLSRIVSEGSDEQAAIEQFASVSLTVRNTGLIPNALGDALQLVDDQGRLFTASGEASAAVARRSADQADALETILQPGITTDLIVVFEVPEEVEGLRLRITGGYIDVSLE
jgi:hypothetical protein